MPLKKVRKIVDVINFVASSANHSSITGGIPHKIYLFTYQGNPAQRTSTKAWKKALEKVGIANFHSHDLWHTSSSCMCKKGTNMQELMELGGLSSYYMVLRYARLRSDHLLDAQVVWKTKN